MHICIWLIQFWPRNLHFPAGLYNSDWEIYISQLADTFLKDKDQVAHVLNAINAYFIMSGFKPNASKHENDSDNKEI